MTRLARALRRLRCPHRREFIAWSHTSATPAGTTHASWRVCADCGRGRTVEG